MSTFVTKTGRPSRRTPGESVRRAVDGVSRPSIAAVVMVYACLMPRELTVTIGGVDFRPYRIALIVFLPMIVRLLIQRPIRLSIYDFLAMFAAFWFVFSMIFTSTATQVLTFGVSQGTDFLLSYLLARVSIRSVREFNSFIVAVLPGFAVTGFLVAVESIFHVDIVHHYLAKVFGEQTALVGEFEERWGLRRAMGSFPSPILAGTMLSSILPFTWLLVRRPRDKAIGLFGVACAFFTVSSTAFINFFFNAVLLFLLSVQKLTRWPILRISSFYLGILLFAATFMSKNGLMSIVIRYLSLNSSTGYYRQFIWTYAGAEVTNHPWFGIGTRDWERPAFMGRDTVDAHWLLQAMRHGYPLAIACILLFVGAALFVGLRARRWPDRLGQETSLALSFALLSLTIAGLSVALWEGIFMWMLMLTGIAVSIGQAAPPVVRQREGMPHARVPLKRGRTSKRGRPFRPSAEH